MSARETTPETSRGFTYRLEVFPQFSQTPEEGRSTAQLIAATALDAVLESMRDQGVDVKLELVVS